MWNGDRVRQFSTTVDISWSDVTLYAEKMHLDWTASTYIVPLSLFLQTAADVNFDHGAFAVGATVKNESNAELLKLDAHGRYQDTSAVWFVHLLFSFLQLIFLLTFFFVLRMAVLRRLFAADEVSVYMGGKKLITVATTIDFTDVLPGALKYHLLVSDGSGSALIATDSSVTWTKPQHTTWEEAADIQVKSVFNPLFGGAGNHNTSKFMCYCVFKSIFVLIFVFVILYRFFF